MNLDPGQITTAVILAGFLVASFDAGIAFIMRASKESTPDD